MNRGEDKHGDLKSVVQKILETGMAVPAVIDMFARVLRELGAAEEAALIAEVADVSRELA